MGHIANKRQERLFDILSFGSDGGTDAGEVGIVLMAVVAIFAMPWTIFRLAKAAWRIENLQGHTDHHKRIIGMLATNFLIWLVMLLVAGFGIWYLSLQ